MGERTLEQPVPGRCSLRRLRIPQSDHRMDKQSRLLELAKVRMVTRWPGYTSIADYHDGIYECDFVSPFTKTAGNSDACVFVLLQDWSSDEELSSGLDDVTVSLGYDPTQPTSRNLTRLLKVTFGIALANVYGTNLFPLVKPGGVNSRIPQPDLIRAAREFALPQIAIVSPRLVVCLGLVTFEALRQALGLPRVGRMAVAIDSPFTLGGSRVWCQAHTGAFDQMNRNKGDPDRVARDWMKMKEDVWPTSVSR